MTKFVLLSFATVLMIVGCRPGASMPALVNEVGDHHVSGTVVRIFEQGELLNFVTAQGGQGEGGPTEASIVPGSGWFVYVQTPAKVWIFNGDGVLYFSWQKAEIEHGFYELSATWDTLPVEPPKDLMRRLPEAMRDLAENRAHNRSLKTD